MTTTPLAPAVSVARVVTFFETLTPDSMAGIGQIYDGQAHFKDPFNEVTGVPAIQRIFDHMFASLHEPRFVVTQQVVQGDQCFLTWEFHFRFRSYRPTQPQVIRGASHLVFAATGLVTLHRDYWDAAEELYEKLPVLGVAMRWLKRRTNH
jgi:hypothetical protein